jgi:hypothetical protein
MITETPDVERALNRAAELWPEDRDNRSKLLHRMLQEGHRSIDNQHEAALAERRAAIESTSGALTGVYSENYLAELREDWPE